MANMFAESSTDSEPAIANAGKILIQPSFSNSNMFIDGLRDGNTIDEDQQDVISRVNNPKVESPAQFGFVEVPPPPMREILKDPETPVGMIQRNCFNMLKSFAGSLSQEPIALGETLIATGENIQQAAGIDTSAAVLDFAKTRSPASMRALIPIAMQAAGMRLQEKTREAVKDFGLDIPEDQQGFMADVGSGMGSIVKSIGLYKLTKSPVVAAEFFGWLTGTQIYNQARHPGPDQKTPAEALGIATAGGAGVAAIEALGLHYFGSVITGPVGRKILLRSAGQAGEEASQQAYTDVLTNVTGVTNMSAGDILMDVLYNGTLGAISGAPVVTITTMMEERGKALGMPREKLKEVVDNFIKNKDQVTDSVATLIQNEASGVASSPTDEAAAKDAMTKILAEKTEIEKATTAGKTDDPKIAAQVILKSNKVSDETKTAVATLMQGEFTMQDLKAVVKENKPPPPTPTTIEEDTAAIQTEDTSGTIIDGRISKLDNDISAHDKQIDQLLNTIDERDAQGKTNVANQNKLDKMLAEREAMDEERANLLTTEKPLDTRKAALQSGEQIVQVKGKKISGMAEESAAAQKRSLNAGFRKGVALAKKNVRQAQNFVTNLINESGLTLQDKGKFLATIKNIQTAEQLSKSIQKIQSRVATLLDSQQRREILTKIKDTVARVKNSNVIAVDFAKQIEALVDEIDTSKRRPETLAALQKTLDFMQNNPDAAMPKDVLDKLEILNKKKLEDISTAELQALSDQIDKLVQQGKTKLSLMESKRERLKQKRLEELKKDSVPISDTKTKRAAIGERLSAMDRIKNRYTELRNRTSRIGAATNPMDVFFDMLDGAKKYLGANHRIFKQTVDKAFSQYLNLKESATREVKNLTDKLGLNEQNFEKIGVWAALQQEGGEQKLLDSGITQAEIDGLTLTPQETQMYQLMRKKLDEMLPAIKEIMRTVYNKDVEGVQDYFPFMTDFEAMQAFEIQDQLGPNLPSIGKKKNVEKGFTEKRVGGKQKIRIDAMGVFLRHVDNAAYLIEMGEHIKSLGDVAQSPEYGESVGDVGQEMVVEWINLLARKGNLPGRIQLIDALRRNAGFAVLGFKLSSILIQPTSMADGAALVGGSYVADGAIKVGTSKEWRQFLWDNFPEIRERTGDDPAYLDMGGSGIVGDVRQAGFWALKHVDAFAASSVAIGTYTKSVEQRGGTVDLSSPDAVAIQEAQLMMRRTQSSAFAKDAPALLTQGALTGNVSVDKLIFQFQSFMLNRWSLLKHDMWALGVKNGDTKQAANIATWMILATAAEIGVRRMSKELIAALTGDDNDPWEDTITKETVLTVLGNVPFISQAVSSLEYGSVPVPSIGLAVQVADRLKLAAQSKDEGKKAQHYAEAAVLLTGLTFGIPGTTQAEAILRKSLKDESGGKKSSSEWPK